MRLLTKKIYRAYPELDKFEDEVCVRYIKRAKRLQNAWKFWIMMLIALPIAFGIWAGLMFGYGYFRNTYYGLYTDSFELVIVLVLMTGIAWIPLLTTLLLRDFWLHRCIRKQLTGVQCPSCGYSLIGLTLLTDTNLPSISCPECGSRTVLKDMGLTEADIDPTLIVEHA